MPVPFFCDTDVFVVTILLPKFDLWSSLFSLGRVNASITLLSLSPAF